MNKLAQQSLTLHQKIHGKLEIKSTYTPLDKTGLSLLYSPGVAQPCLEIKKNYQNIYKYTIKENTVAIISDGSAVLGLGNIGHNAALPVMEGKAMLIKEMAGVNAFPICIKTQNVNKIVEIILNICTSFGAINLEDISAPRCFEVEKQLKEKLNIPVFHDDQHGTAIAICAALINCLKLVKKNINNIKVVIAGTGAAGMATILLLKKLGVYHINAFNINGIVNKTNMAKNNSYVNNLISNNIVDLESSNKSIEDLFNDADVFIGVSTKNVVNSRMVSKMNKNPIIFALANPIPEIMPEKAITSGAYIVCTGCSNYPNQINNLLVFPGLLKGLLKTKTMLITDELKLKIAHNIAALIPIKELSATYVIPSSLDKRVVDCVYKTILTWKKQSPKV